MKKIMAYVVYWIGRLYFALYDWVHEYDESVDPCPFCSCKPVYYRKLEQLAYAVDSMMIDELPRMEPIGSIFPYQSRLDKVILLLDELEKLNS